MGGAVIYRVTHRTRYAYDEPVTRSVNVARLLPRDTPSQWVRASRLEIDPMPDQLVERTDFFGNRTHYLALEAGFTTLEVTATSEVEVDPGADPSGCPRSTMAWEEAVELVSTSRDPDALDARQFAFPSPLVAPAPEIDAYAGSSFPPKRPLADAVVDLSARIHHDFQYAPGSTTTTTGPRDVLRTRQGVCQDYTHFALACLRGRGLPARYVSGYLESAPPGDARLMGAEASHAWVEVWLPENGWLAVDPTNDVVVGDRHVTIAWGRDYSDVPPLKGVIFWEGKDQSLDVSVSVERISGVAPRSEWRPSS